MSDTPRVNKAAFQALDGIHPLECVSAEYARTLERELAEAHRLTETERIRVAAEAGEYAEQKTRLLFDCVEKLEEAVALLRSKPPGTINPAWFKNATEVRDAARAALTGDQVMQRSTTAAADLSPSESGVRLPAPSPIPQVTLIQGGWHQVRVPKEPK